MHILGATEALRWTSLLQTSSSGTIDVNSQRAVHQRTESKRLRLVFPARVKLHSHLSDSPWSCCWLASRAGRLCSGFPRCRRDHQSPAWCNPPECSRWWWGSHPPGWLPEEATRGAGERRWVGKRTHSERRRRPNYFTLPFLIPLELKLMLDIQDN